MINMKEESPEQPDATQRDIYSISRLNHEVRGMLEADFPMIWVEGEISNIARPSSGHLYFSLKDETAQVRCAMFRARSRHIGLNPDNGMQVLARARVSLYEPRGDFQLIVEQMEETGDGALRRAFELLKQRLSAEGLFDPAHKIPLPALPRQIGIITSPSGAAIRDILHVLKRRFPALPVLIYSIPVQGASAAPEIARMINLAAQRNECDVLIMARGGGSLEDLWAFNEEMVARAIYHCPIPIITGVGHEIDFTIADFAADVRAATPSAAAEMVVARKEDFLERVGHLDKRLVQFLAYRMMNLRGRLDRLAGHQAFLAVRHTLQTSSQRLDELSYRARTLFDGKLNGDRGRLQIAIRQLEASPLDRRLDQSRPRLPYLGSLLRAAQRARLIRAEHQLAGSGARLEALSPLAVLGRGYSLTWDETGKLLRNAAQVAPGDPVRVTLEHGELDCRVER